MSTLCSLQEEENENDEVDNENQEGKLAWRGGRAEEATYEAGDAEDKAAAAAAREQAALQAGEPMVRPPWPLLCRACIKQMCSMHTLDSA
jgi:hypothetical protein